MVFKSQATVAMGSQIDGSAKAAKAAKRKSRGDVPKGDAEKIESLHVQLDAMKKLFSLLDKTSQYVESISSTTNTSKNQLKPVLEALQFVATNDLQAIEIGGAARLPDSVLAFLARKQGKCKPFVKARRMSSKGDANFSTPSHVGKIAGLKLHYPQIMDGTITLNDLDKKDQTWILLAALSYTQPITLQRMEPSSEGDGDDNAARRR